MQNIKNYIYFSKKKQLTMLKSLMEKAGFVKTSAVLQAFSQQMEFFKTQLGRLGGRNLYPENKSFKNAQKYTTSDDLYSIVRLLATTCALIPLECYQIKDDKLTKRLKKHINDPILKKALQIKGLSELPETDPLTTFIERPNLNMSKFEFFEALFSFLFIHGEAIMLKETVEYGPNKGKTRQLHHMHPQSVVIQVSNSYPTKILSYSYIIDGITVAENIPPENIIHIKYFNPLLGINGYELRGLSPFKVLEKRIKRSDTNLDITNKQLENGGVPGIVYDKDRPTDWKQAQEFTGKRKQNFYKFLTDIENKGAPYFANGDMGFLPFGSSLVDLDAVALEKVDFKKYCNAFGISDLLFNNDVGTTYDNLQVASKRLYTNACLPNMYRVRDAFQNSVVAEYKGQNKFIDCDLTEIPELQEDQKKTAEWLNITWWLSPNERREVQSYERDPDPAMDLKYVPSNLVPLADTGIADLPITADYETAE